MTSTAIRFTGIGWALGMGRLGSVFGPLAVGAMVGFDASVLQVFVAVAASLLVAVPCVLFLFYDSRQHRLLASAGYALLAHPTGRYVGLDPSAKKR